MFFGLRGKGGGSPRSFGVLGLFWNACSSGPFLGGMKFYFWTLGFSAVSSVFCFKANAPNQNLLSHSNTVGGAHISSDLTSDVCCLFCEPGLLFQ